MRKYGYTLFGGLRVACAAGVADENGNDAEIGGVTACRFDTDLEGDAGEDETADATVAQGELEGRAFEGRHGELVEDGFAGKRAKLGNELKCRRVAKKGRRYLGRVLLALPGHGHAVLEAAHQRRRKRHVAGEDGADACAAGGFEERKDFRQNVRAILDLGN